MVKIRYIPLMLPKVTVSQQNDLMNMELIMQQLLRLLVKKTILEHLILDL